MTTPGVAAQASARGNSFDQIRLAAAAAVILDHAFSLVGRAEPAILHWTDRAFDLGGLAVAVFFIISGYLVMASWINEPSATAFARKRAGRIWPGLIAVVLFVTFVVGPAVTTLPVADYLRHPQTWQYLRTMVLAPVQTSLPGVFTTNPLAGIVNVSLWTLPIEVLAYAILVVVASVALKDRRRWPAPALAAALMAWSYVLGPNYVGGFVTLISLFMIGGTFRLYGLPRSRPLAAGAAAALALSLLIDVSVIGMIALPYLVLYAATAYVARLRHTSRFGDPSYGMYIYGVPIGQVLILLGVNTVLPMFVLSMVLSLAAGYASWHLIEKPALAWVRRDRPATTPAILGVATAPLP